jgi:BlaI family transcriptional regulator, penicillinase repressor
MAKPSGLTRAEWAIIKAVWEQEPCTAPEVQARLAKTTQWAYSTVRTLMDRMVAKGLLRSEKVGHATVYRPGITQQQAQRTEALYALKQAFNGALTPMVQCLIDSRNVTPEELAELEAMIRARKRSAKEDAS